MHGYFQKVGRVLLQMVSDALARFERLAVEQVHLVLGELQQVLGEVGGGRQTHVPLVEVEKEQLHLEVLLGREARLRHMLVEITDTWNVGLLLFKLG